jgi:hypothetical protein
MFYCSLAVCRWRQLSEPADQVVWVDLLTPREFEAGFGSHTPMYSGQTKCVRYYMNFSRAMELAKECLLEVCEVMLHWPPSVLCLMQNAANLLNQVPPA